MADGCPITCPCRLPALGGLAITAAVYAAVAAPVFFGRDFFSLLADAMRTPASPPAALVVMVAGVVAGLVAIWLGYREVVTGEDVPILLWLIAAAAGAVILFEGWSVPRSYGVAMMAAGRGACFAVIAAAAVSLVLHIFACGWRRGFDAATAPGTAQGVRDLSDLVKRQHAEIRDLDSELAVRKDTIKHFADIEYLLCEPEVFAAAQRAARIAFHPDKASTPAEAEQFTELFKAAEAVFARVKATAAARR